MNQGNNHGLGNEDDFVPNKVIATYHGSVLSLNQRENIPFYERNTFLRIAVGILKEMTDFRLLCENVGFLLITLSNFFIFTGYFTPFLYLTDLAHQFGTPKSQASFLISIIGIVNIPARMLYGFVADRRFVSAINLNTFAVVLGTVPLFIFTLLVKTYWSQVVFAIVFAIGIGKYFNEFIF